MQGKRQRLIGINYCHWEGVAKPADYLSTIAAPKRNRSHPPWVIPEAALYSGCPGSISPGREYGSRLALAKGSLGRDDREGDVNGYA
jgi:hypothetical protein